MGIFSDYNIDIEAVKENNFDVLDGVYFFTVAEAEVLEGTQNKPDTTFFVIDYQLEDENGDAVGQKREWFTLAEDGDSETKRATQSTSFLKTRLISLGLKGEALAHFDGSEIVGLTGTLQLKTGPGKNGNPGFQNMRNVKVDEAPEPKKAPAKKATAKSEDDTEIKARVKAKQAARAVEVEEDEDNPFGDED